MAGAELVLINPRRRRRRKGRMPPALRRYWATHSRRKLRNPKRKKARRRRARRAVTVAKRRPAMGYTVGSRKIRRRKLNPRRRHHFRARRRHRNPRFGLPSFRGVMRGTVIPAAVGATGAIALDVVYGYASPYLPAMLQNRWATLAVKIAGALAIGWGASKVLGREQGRAVTLGAVTVVGYGVIKQMAQQVLPNVKGLSGYSDFVDYSAASRGGVGAYLPPGGMGELGYYSPAATLQPDGMGAYLQPGMAGLDGLDGSYNWRNDGM